MTRALMAVMLVSAGLAMAGNPKAASLARAAEQQYRNGQFTEAAATLGLALDLEPVPQFLFNQARALELAGQTARAMELYRRYLHLPAEDTGPALVARARATLDQRIQNGRGPVTKTEPGLKATPTKASLERVSLLAEPAPSPKVPALIITGVSVAALGTGAAFGLLSGSSRASYTSAITLQDKQRFEVMTRQRALIADLAFGAGIASAITAIILFAASDPPLVTVSFAPLAQGALASVGASF